MERLPARLAEHPTVRAVRSRPAQKPGTLDAEWLRQVCL
ncbi:MAG TPA: (4Fe-4S)-binding protein, partial [Mycobacterium sp.]